jgi:hypothetical protein
MKEPPNDTEPPSPVYVLISKLWGRLSEEISDLSTFAHYWANLNIPGRTGSSLAMRSWDMNILSKNAQDLLKSGTIKVSDLF